MCNKKPVVDGPVFGSISIHSFVDTSIECLADVVRVPDQVLDLFFSISLLLPKPVGAEASENRQASYAAVTDLEDLIAVTNWVYGSSNQTPISACNLLTGYIYMWDSKGWNPKLMYILCRPVMQLLSFAFSSCNLATIYVSFTGL